MPYLNYLGQPMPESASPVNNVFGTSAGGETLTAPSGPSGVDSGGGAGDVLIGSSGDNTFFVKGPGDQVQVANGLSGVKTVVAFTSFTLPANVQNLTSSGALNYAAGNALDNLIVVGNDGETLYGGPGNDVLVGGSGADTFIVKAGEGNDVVYNWNPSDHIQLSGTSFKSFADVQAAMKQVGSDVVLQLDSTETVTFRNVTPASFSAQQMLLPLDRSKLGAMTFDDEFNTFDPYNFSTGQGQWQTNFGADPHNPNTYALLNNGELQRYITANFQGTANAAMGINPFSDANGVLTITAQPLPANDSQFAYGGTYSSGMIDTRGIFQQKYGYFEIRMALPTSAQGAWPAFWMIPENPGGVEADIGENTAQQNQFDFVRGYPGGGAPVEFGNVLKTGDITGFHTYGMMWTPSTITFYYDDQAVFEAPTPSTWTKAMYLIANLAVGGFGGQPNAADFPAQMQIDYIHAFALPDGSSTVEHLTPLTPGGTLKVDGGVTTEPAIVTQSFDANGQPVTSEKVVHLSTDPAHASASEMSAAGTNALLLWDQGGAVQGAFKTGSTTSANFTVAVGTIASTQMSGSFLSDGKAVVTWVQTDAGVSHVWAEIIDPSTNAIVTTEELGAGTGDIHLAAAAHGGFAVSWQNGSEIDARGFDGYGYFGDPIAVQGDIGGIDAQGQVVTAWSDASGQHAQLYDLASDPFNPHGTAASPPPPASPPPVSPPPVSPPPVSPPPASGGQVLQAGAGATSVTGGTGDDTITGWAGSSVLRGADGNDSIQGGSGFDDINGNKGDDTINGGPGDDWLVGGQGNDSIVSTGGQDILYGNIGNDTLSGGPGPDLMRGGQGDDIINGGAGNDWLSGDRGSDTITGGAGADTFHISAGAGLDVVTDFNAAEGDRVQLDAGQTYTATQVGADVHIDLGPGDEMVLKNVTLSALPSDWIFNL